MRINHFARAFPVNTAKIAMTHKGDRTSKARAAMTDEHIAQIQAYAREDAKTNVYMSEKYIAMEQAYMAKHVSPDRAGAISQMSKTLNSVMRSGSEFGETLLKLLGSYSGKIYKGQTMTTAEVYNEYGEMIAGYHSNNGYWVSVPTDAEEAFASHTYQIYYNAYTAARAEINAAAAQKKAAPAVNSGASASFDVKA